MACFIVPATEAIVTTVAEKIIKSKENASEVTAEDMPSISFSTKLGWLNKMLWGGSAMLAFEHVWHGEVIPAPPFLTAVKTGDVSQMLSEMGTVGVMMALVVTTVWLGMVAVSSIVSKKSFHIGRLTKEKAE